MTNNYTVTHLHTDHSLLDSCTKYKDYVDRAVELGQKAIAFSEHGNIYCWPMKKEYCESKGIKYIHGVEIYLTEKHDEKIRDNYHTVLIARNLDGVKEINSLVSLSYQEDHFYYKPRISFDEFLSISSNVISTSACLASPLNNIEESNPYFKKLVKKYDYLEVQPHDNPDQMFYNERLVHLSKKYKKPLIAGTDTHSLNKYKSECRKILKLEKKIDYASEDDFDLTYKSYDELVEMFKLQGVLTEDQYLDAINNTNVLADSVEEFDIDKTFKYPILYGSAEKDEEIFHKRIWKMYKEKLRSGVIPSHQAEAFRNAIEEECRVFSKLGMSGFMLFMSEMLTWCRDNDIPTGFGRGSVCGSRVAYILGIIDINPEEWNTIFSRFCNENRVEAGDIDVDFAPDDRPKVYQYIIDRFDKDKTAYVLSLGTISEKGTIDSIGRALSYLWEKDNLIDIKPLKLQLKEARASGNQKLVAELMHQIERANQSNSKKIINESPYRLSKMAEIKKEYDANPEKTKKKYPEIFYYFDGLKDTCISQSIHPAGIVASSWSLPDNYGTFVNKGNTILNLDMDSAHECGLIKYDILGLVNVQIIKDTYKLLGKPYPLSNEINWFDENVWKDMLKSPVGIFQFESDFAFMSLTKFKPKSLFDMSLVTACIRPSGSSYRDRLLNREINKNPSKLIDDLLKNNNGFLIYQEDVIAFLQQVCGLSGSEADSIRRCIAQKREEKLQEAMPSILEGYCNKSDKKRDDAEKEAKEFLKIIEDASAYMFGWRCARTI